MTSLGDVSGDQPASTASAAEVVLDGGDARCVLLLIRLARLVAGLEAGSVVRVITADPAAPLDLPAWCHLTGHLYLGPVPGRDRPTYALQVSGKARPVNPSAPWRPGS
ncbi:sulfurtransferase TusA family protein [Streptosporangium carneum]|uniref:UPF0033 domain-containing protein n=2 Tax=Streptosporangium carneum TaxID=47481 RepID=A0A9W6I7Y0_9ACTN|nr:hypothetical protein GCM10017600_59990 [Streptosporangium carneum]